jgi:hypothetical protein
MSVSVEATIKEREAKTIIAIYELRLSLKISECKEWVDASLLSICTRPVYSCILPSLLLNAGIWVEMDEAAINKLDDLQETFGRALLLLPPSAP